MIKAALILVAFTAVGLAPAAGFGASYLQTTPDATFNLTTSGFTVEAWVKVRTKPGFDPRIIRCIGPTEGPCGNVAVELWQLWICKNSCGAGRVYFGVQDAGVCTEVLSTATIDNGAFHHVAGTYDGANLRIYIDGTLSGTLAAAGLNVQVAGGKLVVANSTDYNNAFDGQIDEMRVWNVARTQAQLSTNMLGEIAPDPAMTGYWRFNGDGVDLAAGHTLVPSGFVTYQAGLYNQAADVALPPSPAKPSPCTASENSYPAISVTWSNVTNEDGYRVYRDNVLVQTLGANQTSILDTPPASGFFTYCVEAFNASGASDTTCDLGSRVPYANHTYTLLLDPFSSWDQAQTGAQSAGGYLATIISADEQQFIDQVITRSNPPTYGGLWLGLTEAGEGQWGWVTNEAFVYTHWAPGEPNNDAGVENRGQIFWSNISDRNLRWNDAPSGGFDPGNGDMGRLGYIVETGPSETPAPATPSPCNASDTSPVNVLVTWANVANEDGYRVYRDGSLVGQTGANITSLADTPSPGTYTYCVEAFNSGGASASQCCNSGTRTQITSAPGIGTFQLSALLMLLGVAGSLAMRRKTQR